MACQRFAELNHWRVHYEEAKKEEVEHGIVAVTVYVDNKEEEEKDCRYCAMALIVVVRAMKVVVGVMKVVVVVGA